MSRKPCSKSGYSGLCGMLYACSIISWDPTITYKCEKWLLCVHKNSQKRLSRGGTMKSCYRRWWWRYNKIKENLSESDNVADKHDGSDGMPVDTNKDVEFCGRSFKNIYNFKGKH